VRTLAVFFVALCLAGTRGTEARQDRGPSTSRSAALAAEGEWFELKVPGGQPTLDRLGIRPEEQGVALPLIARALHGAASSTGPGSLSGSVSELLGELAPGARVSYDPRAVVLAPFTEAIWRRTLQLPDTVDLFAAIVSSRGALLVAAGAAQSTPEVRAWLGRETDLMREVMTLWPGAFANAAPALSMRDRRWTLPGGTSPADEAWRELVGAPPNRPTDFLRRLLERDDGRMARFFAVLSGLDDATRAALLEPEAGATPSAALASLYDLARQADPVGSPNRHPFQLGYADLWSVMRALDDLDPPALPAQSRYWPALVSRDVNSRRNAEELLARPAAASPFAATVRAILDGQPRERRDRIAIVALARRVWEASAPAPDQVQAVYALGHYRRFRGLLLTLDRMDVRTPATWAALVDAARRLDDEGGDSREDLIAAFQGAVAVVDRARRARSLGSDEADRVLQVLGRSLSAHADPAKALGTWLVETLIPALPPLVKPDRLSGTTAYESRLVQALAGPPGAEGGALDWEGLKYRIDVPAAEHERILGVRLQLPGPGLDAAIQSGDRRQLARAMAALVYAPALGDPDGPVTLSPDVVSRHVFGSSAQPGSGREFAWTAAQERTGTSLGWHVAGSLFGIDVALARIALRRLSADDMPAIPTINLNDQFTLARTAVAMDWADLDDGDRDRLAHAIARGRTRVEAAGSDPAAIDGLADETGMSAARRRMLPWTLALAPGAGPALFGLRDLLWLGRPDLPTARLARWGVLGDSVDGRLALRFDPPRAWESVAGRPETGVMATETPDLTLRLVEAAFRLRVPSQLIPSLLLFATQDYWHEVEARFADDSPAMVRGALGITDHRIEDYVAGLASHGPLRPK
jgi:hypothetical protein